MKIRLLGAHASETLDTRMAGMVVNGILALDAAGLTASLTLEEQAGLKAVLLSHNHYDHIKDIPTLGKSLLFAGRSIDIYTVREVIETLSERFLSGGIYHNFMEIPPDDPVFRFHAIEHLSPFSAAGFEVLPVPVNHPPDTVGFQVTSPGGASFFYTSDTGPGLSGCWEKIEPQLIIIDVSETSEAGRSKEDPAHLTPEMLKQELEDFREIRGYLPDVITVHMSPTNEKEIKAELKEVSKELNCRITPGREGMEINL